MTASPALGILPEWNLADLYAAPDDPRFAADLKSGEAKARAFAERYRGKLAALSGVDLATALADYEALSDLLGRVGSYAQLHYVGDTTDASRAKFYGDVNGRLTEISTLLLFFELELNRIDDKALEKAMAEPRLAHYRPWIENLRKEKPYQLDDRIEELFLEKSQTGFGAFNRLFDEGVFAQGIAFPTVPKGKARVRTIVMATHTREQLQFALDAFQRVGQALGILPASRT